MSKEIINFKGIDFDVEFDFKPEEREVRYYPDGSGYPGCPASIDNISIYHKGVNFTEFIDEIVGLDKIEELLWEKFEDYANNRDY
jgi:hypothetical protein